MYFESTAIPWGSLRPAMKLLLIPVPFSFALPIVVPPWLVQ